MNLFSLVLLNLMFSLSANAALQMKPGKWRIQSTVSTEGKPAVDPMAKMREAMAKMTPEQKKQMEEMMGKMGHAGKNQDSKAPKFGFDKDGMTMCYTKEMLETGLDVKKKQEAQKCKVSDHKRTDKSISMKFKCEDGSSGTTEWKLSDDTHMTGITKTQSAKGKKGEINFKAEFLTSKCD